MPDGKRHCAIVLTTDLQHSGCLRRLLPKGKRHCAVALTHIKLRDLLLLLRCRRPMRGGISLCRLCCLQQRNATFWLAHWPRLCACSLGPQQKRPNSLEISPLWP